MFYPKSPFLKNQLVESQIFKRNPGTINGLFEWLCTTPTVTTYRVNLLKTSVLDFVQHLGQLLEKKYDNPPKIYYINDIPEVVCISKLENSSTIDYLHINNLKEIIVDCSCGAALLRGAHVYAPGVLGMQSGTKLGELVNVFADLDGKCKKGTNFQYESERKIFIGRGVVKMQRYQLYGEDISTRGVAVEMISTISGVPSIGDLSSTNAILQNFPSIVCVRILDPQPGETVLDMCSSPGNKTTHIAELMHDTGLIIALDKTETKIKYVQQKVIDCQLKSVKTYAFDSTKAFGGDVLATNFPTQPPYPAATFDRILLDAPCSALGNRPVLLNSLTPKMLESYPNVQRKLFTNAVALLKPGGVLVYSTCTVTEIENEGMVRWALNKFPDINLASSKLVFGGSGLENLGLSEDERKLVQRFGPSETNVHTSVDSVGFFITKFLKSC